MKKIDVPFTLLWLKCVFFIKSHQDLGTRLNYLLLNRLISFDGLDLTQGHNTSQTFKVYHVVIILTCG